MLSAYHKIQDWRILRFVKNWERRWRKWSWSNLKQDPSTYLEEFRKRRKRTRIKWCLSRHLNSWPSRIWNRNTTYSAMKFSRQKWRMDRTKMEWFLQWKIQQDATVYQNFNIPYFKWSSTCFGRHTAHHQDPKTAQAASDFAYVQLLDVVM